MQWYYNVLAKYPCLVVLFVAVFCSTCTIIGLAINSIPDFTDPTLGFETRGTDISNRLVAWQNLLHETGPSNLLVANPNDLYQQLYSNGFGFITKSKNRKHHKRKHRLKQRNKTDKMQLEDKLTAIKKRLKTKVPNKIQSEDEGADIDYKSNSSSWENGIIKDYEITNDDATIPNKTDEPEIFGHNVTFVDEDDYRERVQTNKNKWLQLQNAEFVDSSESITPPMDGYFCDSPAKEYSHFVIERTGPNATDSLFDINTILAMCQLQDQITNVHLYEEYCDRELDGTNCCRPWSLPNYAALLANKSSCFDLRHDDVLLLQNILLSCFEYFHDMKLNNNCSEMKCNAPAECTRNNIVFNVFHFLTDYNIIKINDTNIFLKYSMIFVPVTHTKKILPLFYEWENVDLSNDLVRVAAMDLTIENEVFNDLLIDDMWLLVFGGAFVMTCICLYTTSIFVTSMTCFAVIFSLGLAYFAYTLIFEMAFFPYMNLLAIVVIIGIGADDAFVLVKIWQCVLSERFSKTSTVTIKSLGNADTEQEEETLQNLISLTLKHAAISMLVTSATTAVAFYASYTSNITAIKCFGIFAGTAVISNYVLMVTWLPASVSLTERFTKFPTFKKFRVQTYLIMINKSISGFCVKIDNCITAIIMNYAPVVLLLFGGFGIFCGIVVLYKPGLQLPESSHFQLFVSNHPFEVYNSKLKHEFWFEREMVETDNYKMPLRFVWGIKPIDDGDYDDPLAYGNLHYDNNFNVSTEAAQTWLLQFCQNLRKQPFYQVSFGLLLPNCFIENFVRLMNRVCFDSMNDADRTPCCDISKFPYTPEVFDTCLPQIISSLYATPREYFWPGVAGPKFMAPKLELNSNLLTEDDVNTTFEMVWPNITKPLPIVKALVVEFESNVSFSMEYDSVKNFVQAVEFWFQNQLKTAPLEMQNGWFVSELKFYDVQKTLPRGTIISINVAMLASFIVLLCSTRNILISLYAVTTVSLIIFVTVGILVMLGWKLNILESVIVSTAIGLAVDFSLHYGMHYTLSPTSERLASTKFALSRIIGPTTMAALTTGVAGAFMLLSRVLPYQQIGIFLVVVMAVSWSYSTFFLMSLLKLFGPQYGFLEFQLPWFNKRSGSTSGIKFYERKPNYVTAREQLLTPSSSAVGMTSESHELESLTSNSLIKTISGAECSGQSFSIDYENLQGSKKSSAASTASPLPVTTHHSHHNPKNPNVINETAITSTANMPNISVTTVDIESKNVEEAEKSNNQISSNEECS